MLYYFYGTPELPTTAPHGLWSYLSGEVFLQNFSSRLNILFCGENDSSRNRTVRYVCERDVSLPLDYGARFLPSPLPYLTAYRVLAMVEIREAGIEPAATAL